MINCHGKHKPLHGIADAINGLSVQLSVQLLYRCIDLQLYQKKGHIQYSLVRPFLLSKTYLPTIALIPSLSGWAGRPSNVSSVLLSTANAPSRMALCISTSMDTTKSGRPAPFMMSAYVASSTFCTLISCPSTSPTMAASSACVRSLPDNSYTVFSCPSPASTAAAA